MAKVKITLKGTIPEALSEIINKYPEIEFIDNKTAQKLTNLDLLIILNHQFPDDIGAFASENIIVFSDFSNPENFTKADQLNVIDCIDINATPHEIEFRLNKYLKNNRYKQHQIQKSIANAIINSDISIVTTDTEGNITFVNEKASKKIALPANKLIGQNTSILKSGKHSTEFYSTMWKTIKSGEIWNSQIQNINSQGDYFFEKITIFPILNTKQQIVSYVSLKQDIDNLYWVVEKLRQYEKRFRTIIDNSPLGKIIWDIQAKHFKYVNNKFLDTYRWIRKRLFKMELEQVLLKSNLILENKIPKRNKTYFLETNVISGEGEKIPAKVFISFQDEQSHEVVITIRNTIYDTLLKQKLAKKIEFQKNIINNLTDLIWSVDLNLKTTYVSPASITFFGYRPEILLEMHLSDLYTKESYKKIVTILNSAIVQYKLTSVKPAEIKITVECIYADGHVFSANIKAIPVYNEMDEMTSIVGISRDITEELKLQNELRQEYLTNKITKDLLQNVIDNSSDYIRASDRQGRFIFVNKKFASNVGIPPDYFKGKTIQEVFTDKTLPNYDEIKIKIIEEGKIDLMQIRFPNNKTLLLERTIKIIDNPETNFFAEVSFAHDITAIENAKQALEKANENLEETVLKRTKALKESRNSFRNIFNLSSDTMAIRALDGRFIDVNKKFCQTYKTTPQQMQKYSNEELENLNFFSYNKELLETIKEKGYEIFRIEKINKETKKVKYIELSCTFINYMGKGVLFSIGRDITERVILQEKIVNTIYETEKRERSIFAQELHDGLGGNLAGIKIFLDMIEQNQIPVEQLPEIQNHLKELVNEAIISSKEIASRIKPHVLSNFGLKYSIQEICSNYNKLEKLEIVFHSENYKGSCNEIAEHAIYRIVNELITNTIKHAKASKITITLTNRNDNIILEYSDNGIGFDMEYYLKHSKGNGLQNIRSRIEAFGGKCEIMGNQGKGMFIKIEIM